MVYFDGLIWLTLLVGPLVFLQRQVHREFQAVFLLFTRRAEMAIVLFSLLFLPGVVFHEASHFLVARLLKVRTGRFSFFPQRVYSSSGMRKEAARLQLGYVETAKTDVLRDALIGAAPLVTGGMFVTYAGLKHLGLSQLWTALGVAEPGAVLSVLSRLQHQPDFWLWFYLTFTVSSTMFPSASDRKAWLPLMLILIVLLGISLLIGAGPWLLMHFAEPLNRAFHALAGVLGISTALHLILWPPVWFTRCLLSRLTGLRVVG